MAIIPDVNRIGADAAGRRQQPIIKLPGANTKEALDSISQDINKLAEIRDKSEYSKAKASFLMVKAEQDNAYNDREDYDTFDKEYTHNVSEAAAVGTSMITDPALRDQFVNEVSVMQEQGRQRILNLAGDKEKDQERATIEEEADTLTRTTLNSDGDIVEAYSTLKTRLDAAAAMNVISYEYAQNRAEEARTSMAVSKLQGLEPQDRLEALDESWTKFIPPDKVKQLRDEANAQIRIAEAQGAAFGYIDQGLDRNEALRAIYRDHAKDPLKMNAVKSAFNEAYSTKLVTDVEVQNNVYDEVHLGIGLGDAAVEYYKNPTNPDAFNAWSTMSPAQRDNLERIAASRVAGEKPRTVSDKGAWEALYQSMIDAEGGRISKAEYDKRYMELSSYLKPSDYEMFYKFKAGNNDELISAATLLNSILSDTTVSAEKKQKIQSEVLSWHATKKDRDGVAPSDRETIEHINAKMAVAPGSGTFFDDSAWEIDNMDDRLDAYLDPDTSAAQRKYLKESAYLDGDPDSKPQTMALFEWKVLEREDPNTIEDASRLAKERFGVDISRIQDPVKRLSLIKLYLALEAQNATK